MADTTVQEILERLGEVDPARLEGLSGVVIFDFSGEGGGKWTLTLADGQAKLEEGETVPADVTLSMDAQDFVAMCEGELNAMSAFMQGKIRISGDMALAMRLQSILT
ncbi:MAG TPA: SCP2 sterol-binding domain-containing protein [Chloroflexi bacterium]|nr:SCP2 sterol-binding domain-containing protein [Chloroflexota bacterium]